MGDVTIKMKKHTGTCIGITIVSLGPSLSRKVKTPALPRELSSSPPAQARSSKSSKSGLLPKGFNEAVIILKNFS